VGATDISSQVLIPTRPSKGDDRWACLQRGAIADLVLEKQQAVEGEGLAGQRPDGGGSGELNSVGIPPRTTGCSHHDLSLNDDISRIPVGCAGSCRRKAGNHPGVLQAHVAGTANRYKELWQLVILTRKPL
jgi:hypothetical protein